MKSDGFPTYHLANVVDDHLMHITDVIRAEEWISSTPKHVLLYHAFGWQLPRFWHMPLLRNLDKSKISKRKNPVSLIYYRQAGFLPEAMINFLGLMGGGMPDGTGPVAEKFTLGEMVERFDVKNIRLGGPVFDLTKLKWLNGEYLRALTPEKLLHRPARNHPQRQLPPARSRRSSRPASKPSASSATSPTSSSPTTSSRTAEVFVPKKRTLEETLAFAAEQLTVLEATDWTHEALEPALKKLGEENQWSVKDRPETREPRLPRRGFPDRRRWRCARPG